MNKTILCLLGAIFMANMVYAAAPATFLMATFTTDRTERSLVGDEIAEEDGISVSFGDGAQFSESSKTVDDVMDMKDGATVVVRAEQFHNIWRVNFTGYSQSEIPKMIAVSGIPAGSETADAIAVTPTTSGIVQSFVFDKNYTEITFSTDKGYYLKKMTVSEDITPSFDAKDGVEVFGDEKVPFVKKSNYIKYRYAIKDHTEEDYTFRSDDESMMSVPDAGISMSGKADGKYDVWVDVETRDDNFDAVTAPRRLVVNYAAKEPNKETTELINEVENKTLYKYYDLSGREVKSSDYKGLIIRKSPTRAELIRNF